jgi:hypothetical protein
VPKKAPIGRVQASQKKLDHHVPVGRHECLDGLAPIERRARREEGFVSLARRRAFGRRTSCARPRKNFVTKEPPFAAHPVPWETYAKKAIDVLRVDAEEACDVSGGEKRIGAVQVLEG